MFIIQFLDVFGDTLWPKFGCLVVYFFGLNGSLIHLVKSILSHSFFEIFFQVVLSHNIVHWNLGTVKVHRQLWSLSYGWSWDWSSKNGNASLILVNLRKLEFAFANAELFLQFEHLIKIIRHHSLDVVSLDFYLVANKFSLASSLHSWS